MVRGSSENQMAAQILGSRNNAPISSCPRTMIWTFGPDGKCRSASKSWLEYRGATLEDERGDGWILGLHPDDRQSSLNLFRGAFKSRRVFEAQFRVQRADGSYAWIRGHGVPRYLNDGRFLGYSGELKEIDGAACPKDHAQAISAKTLEHWLIKSGSPLFVLDASGAVIFRNPAAVRFLATHAATKEISSLRCHSDIQIESPASDGKPGTLDPSALAGAHWIVELRKILVTAQQPAGGFIVFPPEGTIAAGTAAAPDRAFIHDLLNIAMGVQVIADLLEGEDNSREERREYAKLLSRTACQLLSEIERQKLLFDRAEPDQALERVHGSSVT
jgi:PAS domain S-box-containing protein